MKIYVGHSSGFDFEEKLYLPLRESSIADDNELVFPHEDSDELFDSKTFLQQKCDLFVAEVTEPSTGLGIELGWAEEFNVQVLCVYRDGSNPSGSLETVTADIESYEDSEDLIEIINDYAV